MKTKKTLGLPCRTIVKWGQNFLRDPKILKKIADFAQITKNDLVIEVGPGEGTLTKFLLERARKVIAVEKDGELAKLLEAKFEREIIDNRLKIINEDVLNYELRIKNYALVGNIPYYLTGALFRKIFETENLPSSITFVVQKEVAERIMARNNKESVLSISIKAYGTPEYGGTIKAGSFYPKPKVDSAIISIKNIGKKRFEEITPLIPLTLRGKKNKEKIEEAEKKFFEILKKGFVHKRKLLSKNLSLQSEILERLGLNPKARAEDLHTDDWFRLVKSIK